MPIGRERILIQSLLGGSAPAPAIASIVEEKDREAAVMKLGQILEPMDDIAGVADGTNQPNSSVLSAA